MFARLFGETEELQLQNMKKKVILTAICAVICAVGLVIMAMGITEDVYSIGAVLMLIPLFMWGSGAIKNLFGIATIGAIFSNNGVIGVLIFGVFVVASFLISVFVALLGCGRYIYLIVKRSSSAK